MSPEEVSVLELIWSHLKQHRDWPPKARFAVLLRQQGLDLDTLAAPGARWISASFEKVSVTFDALLTLPEVRHILEPLPVFLRLLARRFVEQTDPDEGRGAPEPRVEAAEFFALWEDQGRAMLATQLLDRFMGWDVQRVGDLDSDTFYFRPWIENLRYEDLQSIDDFLAQPRRVHHGKVKRDPQGRHLALLQAIYASVRKTGHWPKLVRFTLENRDTLGFIPELVDELTPAFIRKDSSSYGEPRRMALTNRALPYVAGETGPALAASIVRAVGDLWFDTEEKTFTIEQIAAKLKLPVGRVLPVARLLEDQCWGWAPPGDMKGSSWHMRVREEVIHHFVGVRSWDEYVAIREKRCPEYEDSWEFDADRELSSRELADAAVKAAIASATGRQTESVPAGGRQPTGTSPGARPKVFLGHGHSLQWRALKDFLKDELQLDPVEFNSASVAGKLTVQRLKDVMEECALAFLVMTAELELANGGKQARPNVIHEIGLFQGRLGFEKTIILMEKDCTEFSNIAGLGYISFPPNDIQACFESVRRAVRERLS